MRRPTVMLPVRSFVAEALNRPPEVTEVVCVSIVETAAEKLVSLKRRTAMEMAGASRDPDLALARHIYGLHMTRDLVDPAEVVALARAIAETDAREFASQYPAYAADIADATRKALDALHTDPLYRERYDRFMADMDVPILLQPPVTLPCIGDDRRPWLDVIQHKGVKRF
jgi:Nucleotidyl transferase AbiEii toxin, Type IV TA system